MATPNGSGRPTGSRLRRRIPLAVATAVLVLSASVAVGYRVLAPAEVVIPARVGLPVVPDPAPGVIGTLNAAPLIVDGRLRVYATTRTVWADHPIDARTRRTPYWSYRRWPAQLAGVVAAGTTVVTRWSDGELVALDARTGQPRWRAVGPRPGHGYVGRRTGAATVYAPTGLFTAVAADGTRVLVIAGSTERRGMDLDSGRLLWRSDVDRGCRAGDPEAGLTTGSGELVLPETCAGAALLGFYDVATGRLVTRWHPTGPGAAGPGSDRPGLAGPAPTGRATTGPGPVGPRGAGSSPLAPRDVAPEPAGAPGGAPAAEPGVEKAATGDLRVVPLGCPTGRSGCRAIRTEYAGVTRGWLLDQGAPVAAPTLDWPETVLVDDVAVAPDETGLVARAVRSGARRWRWTGGRARVLAVQPGRVHLRTEAAPGGGAGDLVTLETATGAERSRFPFTYGRDSTTWAPGFAYAASGFVAVERLAEPVDPTDDDRGYYLGDQPVILAAT
ncbi:PQQ-binding-like beta-propeller repeat protein [Micromonospora sp. HM5-17]|uniref:outer membrane protein assembly factor BamB family protein n=1 Tax=Micromonospora sp. HM5-17 TaxID=2487710 RepID=UPI000F4932E6|nr:PQQ-binding-like beta-propeller repeat protein [Micromonospora sp. HM5-17]ROT28072.1 pyrrolo-quinoline quinone [Micromonospora sp. HM5-17]